MLYFYYHELRSESMKKYSKKILPIFLILATLVTMFATLSTASAASYTYNTGKRGTVCTSLSSKAKAYYTGSYVYSTLSTKSASTIKSSLKTLMTSTHKTITTYENLKTYTKYSDSTAGSTSKMTLFYTSSNVSSTWDSKVWNREHVWCQSLGTFTTANCGADLHHLRPADPKINSTRNNLPYGNVKSSGSYKTATTSSGVVGGYYTSKNFEPLDNAKGDVARILLYCYVRWGETNLTDVIQSTDVLLDWCKSDPVDTWEMGRNDSVQSIQGNRNVFIDYPEYAWLLFNKSVPSMTTPSGMAKSGSSSSTSGKTYSLVTSAPSNWAGDYVIVGKSGSTYYVLNATTASKGTAAGAASSAKTLSAAGITRSGNKLTGVSNNYVYTCAKSGSYYTFKMKGSSNYLSYKKNGLTTATSASGTAAQWKLSLSSGAVKMQSRSSTSYYLGFNASSKLFRCYTSTSTYKLYLYKAN